MPFGVTTARDLDRYLRVRAKHQHAAQPRLWLGVNAPSIASNGIYQMLSRRVRRPKYSRRWLRTLRRLTGADRAALPRTI